MPRQIYKIRDFSGGINNTRNTKDLADNESVQVQNLSVDIAGSIRSAGTISAHSDHAQAGRNIDDQSAHLNDANLSAGGGYHLYYFESDHDTEPTSIAPVTNKISFSTGGAAATGGTSTVTEIDDVNVESNTPLGT